MGWSDKGMSLKLQADWGILHVVKLLHDFKYWSIFSSALAQYLFFGPK